MTMTTSEIPAHVLHRIAEDISKQFDLAIGTEYVEYVIRGDGPPMRAIDVEYAIRKEARTYGITC